MDLECHSSGGSRISQGGVPTLEAGAPTHDFAKISQKLHEIESIWTPRGRGDMRPKFYYVDPPLHKMCLLSCSELKFKNIVGGVKCYNKFG